MAVFVAVGFAAAFGAEGVFAPVKEVVAEAVEADELVVSVFTVVVVVAGFLAKSAEG